MKKEYLIIASVAILALFFLSQPTLHGQFIIPPGTTVGGGRHVF